MTRLWGSVWITLALLGCGPKKPAQDPADAPNPAATNAEAPPSSLEGGDKLGCANVRCAAGTHCELVQVQCVTTPCDPVPECKPDPGAVGLVACGKNVCSAGQVCCNASCGICTEPGRMCIQMACP